MMESLSGRISQAALWGRTNYGRALTKFAEEHPDALGPRSSLLVLGDARSNYSDLALPVLADLAGRARHAWWLNPEHPRHWDTGDSARPTATARSSRWWSAATSPSSASSCTASSEGGLSRRGSRGPAAGRSRRAAPGGRPRRRRAHR